MILDWLHMSPNDYNIPCRGGSRAQCSSGPNFGLNLDVNQFLLSSCHLVHCDDVYPNEKSKNFGGVNPICLGKRWTDPEGLYQIFEGGNILPFRLVYSNIIRPQECTFFFHNLVEGKQLSVNCWSSWSFWQSLQASWSPSSTSPPLFCQQKKILIWSLYVICCMYCDASDFC